MKLFDVEKVPVILTAWSGATERAPQHDETKVVKATLAIQLTPALGSAFLPGDGEIRAVAFKAAGDGSVRPFLRSSGFTIAMKKQQLIVHATPDSDAGICFSHVRMMKTVSVRIDVKMATLVLRCTVGPCGPQEYAYLGEWHRSQRFVTFEESDPALEFQGDQPTEGDEKARRPYTPEFDDPRDDAGREDGHRYPKRGKKRKLRAVEKQDPDADVAGGRRARERARREHGHRSVAAPRRRAVHADD